MEKNVTDKAEEVNNPYIPLTNPQYVKYGNYETVKQLIQSNEFTPTWITGLSGNGKTEMVEQACAELKREFFRINFTSETDESDLLGAQRLIESNGATVTTYEYGVCPIALKRGGILLLDEIDLAHPNRVMCLQSILEGKGVFLKQTKEWVRPAKGFQIFATSNTKGRGDESGRFIGTSTMNNAMLDRFVGTIHQDYPDEQTEYKILCQYYVDRIFTQRGITQQDEKVAQLITEGKKFCSSLTTWANQIRDTVKNGGDLQEVITTRTLINIIRSYAIFGKRKKSIEFSCERYPDDIRDTFIQTYNKLHPDDEYESVIPDSETAEYAEFKRQSA